MSEIINDTNVLATCGCCFSSVDNLIEVNSRFQIILSDCFSLKISDYDEFNQFPTFVCIPCVKKVHECYTFRCKIIESQSKLREIFSSMIIINVQPKDILNSEQSLVNEFQSICDDNISADFESMFMQNNAEVVIYETVQKSDLQETISAVENITNYVEKENVDFSSKCEDKNTAADSNATNKNSRMRRLKKISCKICSKQLTKEYMSTHMKIHAGKTDFHVCPLCEERFTSFGRRVLHIREVHDLKNLYNYRCKICFKKYTTATGVAMHVRKFHLKERNFCCEICGKIFFNNAALKRHVDRHFNESNYKCDVCSKSLSNSWSLKMHMDAKHKSVKYKCTVCDKEFAQKGYLKIHKKNHDE